MSDEKNPVRSAAAGDGGAEAESRGKMTTVGVNAPLVVAVETMDAENKRLAAENAALKAELNYIYNIRPSIKTETEEWKALDALNARLVAALESLSAWEADDVAEDPQGFETDSNAARALLAETAQNKA